MNQFGSAVIGLALLGLLICAGAFADEPALPAGLGKDEPTLPAGFEAIEPSLPVGLNSQEPELPAGLEDDEPALPAGIGETKSGLPAKKDSDEPDLPMGMGEEPSTAWNDADENIASRWGVSGFWELRGGLRIYEPIEQRNASLAESRLELEKDFNWNEWNSKLTVDLLYDDIPESHSVDLENGSGWLDLREAWLHRSLGEKADVKFGRQVLTWGVGDLLFINDLFPKDWQSFLAGRDEQYLKAPSDSVRFGLYSPAVNFNLVYTPRFDSDRYIDGSRLSYFSSSSNEVVGRNMIVDANQPDDMFADDELAIRVYRQLASFEVAAYAYDGFWKSPGGFDPSTGLATFPALRVFGASVRGPLGPGIFSSEIGYYNSRDDSNGSNAFINNSEWRGLLGYEWEVANETTLGLQYYVEALQDFGAYKTSLLPGQMARDEYRQVLTARLTRLAMSQNLTLSLFVFYSPTDADGYLRPKASYKASDQWLLEGGFNIFNGSKPFTFFGQFESNSNAYLAIRYSF
jgi:hypothetical protein